jgi:smf protein
LTRNEQKLIAVLKQHDCRTLDQLAAEADLDHSVVASLLFDLNMRGFVKTLPGGAYRLVR